MHSINANSKGPVIKTKIALKNFHLAKSRPIEEKSSQAESILRLCALSLLQDSQLREILGRKF